jgi:hypothetical protein
MWADWLRDYIPREMMAHQTSSTTFYPSKKHEAIKRRTGDPHSVRIKCVCRQCNNIWMSRLQEEAKPYLVPMLIGEDIRLLKKGQVVVAAWATMMVMVSEYLTDDMVAIPAADRRRLHIHRLPPSRWRIWIGQHRREAHPLFAHNVVPLGTEKEFEALTDETSVTPNTQTSTICLGDNLVIHVMGASRVWRMIRRWQLPRELGGTMAQIWPVQTPMVLWPTSPMALNDAGLDLLSQHFFDTMKRYARPLIRG